MRISVHILEAQHLPSKTDGPPFSYVKLHWQDIKHKTQIVNNNVYNEIFELTFDESDGAKNSVANIEVWTSYPGVNGRHTVLGRVPINLRTLKLGRQSRAWYALVHPEGHFRKFPSPPPALKVALTVREENQGGSIESTKSNLLLQSTFASPGDVVLASQPSEQVPQEQVQQEQVQQEQVPQVVLFTDEEEKTGPKMHMASVWSGLAGGDASSPGSTAPGSPPPQESSSGGLAALVNFAQQLGDVPVIKNALAAGSLAEICKTLTQTNAAAAPGSNSPMPRVYADDEEDDSNGPAVAEHEWMDMAQKAQRGDLRALQWIRTHKQNAPKNMRRHNADRRHNRERQRHWNRQHPLNGTTRLLDKPVEEKMVELLPWCSPGRISETLRMFNFNAEKAMDYLLDNRLNELGKTMRPAFPRPLPAHVDVNKTFIGSYNPSENPEEELRRTDTATVVPASVLGQVNEVMADNGKRKALLIGINYSGTKNALMGCIEDTKNIRNLLVNLYGFPDTSEHITCLTDDSTNPCLQPTRKNILLAIKWLVKDAKPGSVLFFHFSGHGSQKRNLLGTEADGYDETIMPVDYKHAGEIIDDELYLSLVKPLPAGAKLVCLMDCCHSGSGLDLPYVYQDGTWNLEAHPKFAPADVQLIAGCRDNQTSADFHVPQKESGGAMTKALRQALATDPNMTYSDLMSNILSFLDGWGFDQVPQLSSSQRFSVQRRFALNEILKNSNPLLGKLEGITKRRALPPPPPPMPSFSDTSRGMDSRTGEHQNGDSGQIMPNYPQQEMHQQHGMIMQQGMNHGMNSGVNSNMNPGMNNPGMNSGMNSGMNPGMNSGMNPGMNSGMNSGMNPGMNNPGMMHGMMPQQGMNPGMNPGMNSNSNMPPGMNPGMMHGSMPGMMPQQGMMHPGMMMPPPPPPPPPGGGMMMGGPPGMMMQQKMGGHEMPPSQSGGMQQYQPPGSARSHMPQFYR